MKWKILLPLVFAALLFTGGSTTALAEHYLGYRPFHYRPSVVPCSRYYGQGHKYLWYKQGGPGHYDGWKYHGARYRYGPWSRYYYPYSWHGGPFFGGSFFLPGWGVVLSGHGRR
jgi:hypothetical protein